MPDLHPPVAHDLDQAGLQALQRLGYHSATPATDCPVASLDRAEADGQSDQGPPRDGSGGTASAAAPAQSPAAVAAVAAATSAVVATPLQVDLRGGGSDSNGGDPDPAPGTHPTSIQKTELHTPGLAADRLISGPVWQHHWLGHAQVVVMKWRGSGVCHPEWVHSISQLHGNSSAVATARLAPERVAQPCDTGSLCCGAGLDEQPGPAKDTGPPSKRPRTD